MKIISNEHFNGSYINDMIIARKNIKQNQLFNSKWIDFTLIDGYDIRVFNFNNDHILTWTKDFYHFAALYKNNQLYYITKLFDSQKVERHKNWILLWNQTDLCNTKWIVWFGPLLKIATVDFITKNVKVNTMSYGYKNIRGGTPFVEYNGYYYCFAHERSYFPRSIKCVLIKMNKYIQIENQSKPFTFFEDSYYEYPMSFKYENDYFYLLLGKNDKQLVEIEMSVNDLFKMLN